MSVVRLDVDEKASRRSPVPETPGTTPGGPTPVEGLSDASDEFCGEATPGKTPRTRASVYDPEYAALRREAARDGGLAARLASWFAAEASDAAWKT